MNFVKATGFCNDDMDTTIKRLKKSIDNERNDREALKKAQEQEYKRIVIR